MLTLLGSQAFTAFNLYSFQREDRKETRRRKVQKKVRHVIFAALAFLCVFAFICQQPCPSSRPISSKTAPEANCPFGQRPLNYKAQSNAISHRKRHEITPPNEVGSAAQEPPLPQMRRQAQQPGHSLQTLHGEGGNPAKIEFAVQFTSRTVHRRLCVGGYVIGS